MSQPADWSWRHRASAARLHAGPVRLAGPHQSTRCCTAHGQASRLGLRPGARAGAQARMHLAAWQKTLVTVTEVAKKARRAARKGLPPPGASGAAAAPGSTEVPPQAGDGADVPGSAGVGVGAGGVGGLGLAEGQGGAAGGVGAELQAELDEAMERVQKWQDDVVRLRKCVRCAARPAGQSRARAATRPACTCDESSSIVVERIQRLPLQWYALMQPLRLC